MGGSDWGADWGGLKTALGDWKPVLWARMEQKQIFHTGKDVFE